MIRRLKIFILLSLLLPSIVFSQLKEFCKYVSKKRNIQYSLILYENKTFRFNSRGHLIFNESEGTWIIKKKKIYLNSINKYKTGYLEVIDDKNIEITKSKQDFEFIVYNQDSIPLVGATFVYNNIYYIVPNDGFLHLTPSKDSIFEIKFLGETYYGSFKKNTFYRKNIFVNQSKKDFVFFKDETWKIYNKKLKMKNGILLYQKDCY